MRDYIGNYEGSYRFILTKFSEMLAATCKPAQICETSGGTLLNRRCSVWIEFVNREPQAAGKASQRSIAEGQNEADNSVAHG
jgi:hypothetical protein